jgi:filamentous hemagglutinin family protein
LLFSCAIGSALVLATHGEQAKAQAFQADPTTVAGGVSYNRATPGVETITVDTNTATINWEPNVPGNPIPFLPAGNVATFQNGPSNSDFVVLNRIEAIDPVRFDGTVLGRLQGAGGGTPGGTILFSSPGGIIVGANALFDVGSLVLTTLNVVDDGAGDFISPGGGFQFDSGSDSPNAAIITEAGSQIVATAENSYIALVAPVIVHGGSVSVNGSAAYLAGEELEFTVNQGLFDIIVTTGSDNPTPITHAASASTGGPASTGGTDNHAIYMVAVPKNQAIQMLPEARSAFSRRSAPASRMA